MKDMVRRTGCRVLSGVWIDVGAHLGAETLPAAKQNPELQVYAFEPNLKLAAESWGALPNFIVISAAVAETEGLSDFYLNANAGASSLLPFNPAGLTEWIGGDVLRVEAKINLPPVRLDPSISLHETSSVEHLHTHDQV